MKGILLFVLGYILKFVGIQYYLLITTIINIVTMKKQREKKLFKHIIKTTFSDKKSLVIYFTSVLVGIYTFIVFHDIYLLTFMVVIPSFAYSLLNFTQTIQKNINYLF